MAKLKAKAKKSKKTKKSARLEPMVSAPDSLKVVQLKLPPPWMHITDDALIRSAAKRGLVPVAFRLPPVPPSVLPKGMKPNDKALMANDSQIIEANAWAAEQVYNGAYINGVTFLGYTYLSELAQRPEYRRVSEVLAVEMTRKWIELKSTSDDKESKAPKIAELTAELKRLDVQGAFREMVEIDGFMGRAHLYLDTGDTDDRAELVKPIGDGHDEMTRLKFKDRRGFLKAVKPIEPVWCYPAKYNANDPLKPDWYNPQSWFVQGKEIHVSRLLSFVGRKVPDLLKPSYNFGGLSLSQMAKPYIDNWLRTRQAVADLVWSFSLRGIKTDMAAMLGKGGDQLIKRAILFANLQNNQGLMMLDKDKEDVFNITTPLASLDALQAQSQEHMCSVTGTPVVKLLGIQPAGLNASSEGEMDTWRDWVAANQEKFFRRKLETVVAFVQMSLWGEVDPDIVVEFCPIEELNELEEAQKEDAEASTAEKYVTMGALDPLEVRKKIASDPNSPYDGLDVDDAPLLDEDDGQEQLDLGEPSGQLGALEPRDQRLEDRTRQRGGPDDTLVASRNRAGRDDRMRSGDR